MSPVAQLVFFLLLIMSVIVMSVIAEVCDEGEEGWTKPSAQSPPPAEPADVELSSVADPMRQENVLPTEGLGETMELLKELRSEVQDVKGRLAALEVAAEKVLKVPKENWVKDVGAAAAVIEGFPEQIKNLAAEIVEQLNQNDAQSGLDEIKPNSKRIRNQAINVRDISRSELEIFEIYQDPRLRYSRDHKNGYGIWEYMSKIYLRYGHGDIRDIRDNEQDTRDIRVGDILKIAAVERVQMERRGCDQPDSRQSTCCERLRKSPKCSLCADENKGHRRSAMKAVVLALAATAFIFLVYLKLNQQLITKLNPATHRQALSRQFGFDSHHLVFDPLVANMERRAENGDGNGMANEVKGAYDYFNDEGKLNITLRIIVLFPWRDTSPKDGYVDFKELEAWNTRMAMGRLNYRTQREIEARDKDADGTIGLRDISTICPMRNSAGWWREQFENADIDRNCTLDFTEFKDFLHPEDSQNEKIQKWLLKEKIKRMDYDEDGRLTYSEFVERAYDTYRNYIDFESACANVPSPETIFGQLDVNKDGFLSVKELMPILRYLHPGELAYAKYFTSYLFHEADENKDRRLTLDEMLNHERLGSSVDTLVEDFEAGWTSEMENYSRQLIEFCGCKALSVIATNIEEEISDGSFSRFTFDMMLAWETPTSTEEEEEDAYIESVAKGKEDTRKPVAMPSPQDDVSLFYSDIMPLLVNNEPNVGEDAFVWLGSLVPLVVDVVNGRFTFETLTAPTAHRLHFPAYDRFLKEVDKCIKHLQKLACPTGVEFADDEYILHVEGTACSQRVVRHIGGTSWPGRLTLTNYALYFETAGKISYEDALKIDLSKEIEHSVKPAATGPWGAPLFDKAIVYESPELSDGIVIEFPEITSSTRRDHWLALTKEVMLMHQFLSKYKVESPFQKWEVHARSILGIIRLHAAREMLRISPPNPIKFMIFSLFDELPKGDLVMQELADSLDKVSSGHPCSASSILRTLNMSAISKTIREVNLERAKVAVSMEATTAQPENHTSLENVIHQVREEAKEVNLAKATTDTLKQEGVSDSAMVLMELLKPLRGVMCWLQQVVFWERPAVTLVFMASVVAVAYNEWIGKAIALCLLWLVREMIKARLKRVVDKCPEIIMVNIAFLKIRSVFVSRAPKHSNTVMTLMVGCAAVLAVVPFKYIIIGSVLCCFAMTSRLGGNDQGNRRMREWWDSIPVIPIKVTDKPLGHENEHKD
ncbi:unnamed protein product [Rhodiola kirilowii]